MNHAIESWITALPEVVQEPVLAFSDPHPPGARARAMFAASAVVARVRSWPAGEAGLAEAIDDLIARLHQVGQTTVHQPGIANTLNYILAEGLPADRTTALNLLESRLAVVQEAMTTASTTIARLGADLLQDGDEVLVHDFADRSTQAVISRAAGDRKRLSVIATACRSRRADGIRVARESVAVGHRATVVTDAGVAWAVARGGLRACFIGADAVMPDGTVLTTPGALTIALTGRQSGVPVYAATDLWKMMPTIPPALRMLNEAPDPDGVPEALEWQAAGYAFFNPLVDFVSGELLTSLITEAGIISPSETGQTAYRTYGLGLTEATR